MPNSCNSITKNICIALLVSSCASTQNYQAGISLNGKFLASNGSNTFPFNVLLQSNSDVDIIHIKKPFYGNVLRAEVDKNTAEILMLKTINDLQQFEMGDVKILSSQIIKIFYRCLSAISKTQNWNDGSFKVQCNNSEEKIILEIETDIWTISGFFKL
ncbi:hypothetical protein N9K04_01170 [Gammaproteobacteria bacterium]|nr:hypothetical protein [Gammaproteobacteria bacterium]MDB3877656.1 hypothetical protein [Gammaproteobacteria bacterium]MDC0090471.1 hypothetical protein [Gammaproteobacteria bacterium]MDC1387743.1 hypothetical protein [Gammaproteobacteria bacterium]